ncbi:MAG: hypothetical protein U0744_08510 [Gemmataceae bacterium]
MLRRVLCWAARASDSTDEACEPSGAWNRGKFMKHNTDPAFKGVQAIKDAQAKTLALFESSADKGDWMRIHEEHYDWWMFPTDEPSGFGLAWTVYEGDIADLKTDAAYLERYLRGVRILATSWGWDLAAASEIANPQPGQAWQHWPIRLFKAAKSTKLFGFDQEFASLKKLGNLLMSQGETMYYHRDLSWLFK